jgi:hypothetical protein
MIGQIERWAFGVLCCGALLVLFAGDLTTAADKASDPQLQDVKDKAVKKGDKGVNPEKPKIDWEQDNQLEKKNWEGRENLTTRWKITSPTLKPPRNAKGQGTFKTFPDGPGEYVEVVVGDGQEWAVIPKDQPEKNIKFWGTVATDSADLWPVKAEGNLSMPGNGEGLSLKHWSAKMSNEEVIFNPNPVKTGYALKDDGSPWPKKIKQAVTATFSPKSLAADAKIVLDDPHGRIETIAEKDLTRDAVAGTIKFNVYGKFPNYTPTDQPNGDAAIKATKADGKEALKGEGKVIVVIPMSQTQAVTAQECHNDCSNVGNASVLASEAGAVVLITIKDQFDINLDSIYDGQNKVWEDVTGQISRSGYIYQPDSMLSAGVKKDWVALRGTLAYQRTLTDDEMRGWKAHEKGAVEGHDNVWSLGLFGINPLNGKQKLQVWGHNIELEYDRELQAFPLDLPKYPVTVKSTAHK